MDLDATIEKYESSLTYYKLLPDSYSSTAADVKQLIEWLKDYKRLLEAEKKWNKYLRAYADTAGYNVLFEKEESK